MSRKFSVILVTLFAGATLAASGSPAQEQRASSQAAETQAEARVVSYIQQNLKTGQPLLVSGLYAHFTQPAERQALGKLYNAFFRIPLFVAQYQRKYSKPPTLRVISQQFDLHSAQAASVLLSVMESDPRVPRFISRDPQTHEITHVDVKMIEDSPRFGQALAHQLSGWEGKPAPPFHLERLGGGSVDSSGLQGKPYLLYVWFTGCPPCMKETPTLVSLMAKFSDLGFTVIGANADQLLKLGYDDSVRQQYSRRMGINFPLVTWSAESNRDYGNIAIFPTLFLVGRDGVIQGHWVGYTPSAELQTAVARAASQ
ncbi:MAG: TlpA family protein disulfide reductase [Acidobacteriota bacterium]|nr:TlpA family protein disulfide reductase [Acidobacteriota bacterium]